MNNDSILGGLDPEVLNDMGTRRDALKGLGHWSAKLALASIPLGLAAMAKTAYAQTTVPTAIANVLNFALILEELEAEFYGIAVGKRAAPAGLTRSATLIPSSDRSIFETLSDHEDRHVELLRSALGGQAVAKPTFDFSGGNGSGTGAFASAFSNYQTFLALSQSFEDTGVRAYKGQAPALFAAETTVGNRPFLTIALRIHSVEARHASEVRRLRGNFSEQAPNKGWITGNDSGGAPAAIYAGEDNTAQGSPPATAPGINVATLPGATTTAATESFDEPLTRAQVVAIVDPFIVEPIS